MSDHTGLGDRPDGRPAVAYYRCSSKQQELSVNDQRREVEAYAQRRGYRILREYVDEGRSASKEPEKRTAFNRMIADARAGDFRAVLCYDAARFTRFDNIEGSMPKHALRTNGVVLDTVKEGEFDWGSMEGRWKDVAFCEANKANSLNISRDSIRGRVNVLKLGLGYWPNGVVPYGYDREYTDGVRTVRVSRYERFKKGKGWHLRLVVNADEAVVVREVFDLYVNHRWSRRQIAIHLTGRQVPPPRGQNNWSNGAWGGDNVKAILREKAYIGYAVIGGRRGRKTVHNRVEPQEQPNCCPVVVDPQVWHEAQAIDRKRGEGFSKPQPGRGGLLSGFLVCGHCGYALHKRKIDRAENRYSCTTASARPHLGCKHYAVNESELVPRVSGWLVRTVEEAAVEAMRAAPPADDGRTREESLLARQVDALEAKVSAGTDSALLAPPELREEAWAKVRGWRGELEEVRQRLAHLKAVSSAPQHFHFERWWGEVKERIVWLETTCYNEAAGERFDRPAKVGEFGVGNPSAMLTPVLRDHLRTLLARLGFSCKLWWERRADRKRMRDALWVLKDVQIELDVDLSPTPFPPASNPTTRAG